MADSLTAEINGQVIEWRPGAGWGQPLNAECVWSLPPARAHELLYSPAVAALAMERTCPDAVVRGARSGAEAPPQWPADFEDAVRWVESLYGPQHLEARLQDGRVVAWTPGAGWEDERLNLLAATRVPPGWAPEKVLLFADAAASGLGAAMPEAVLSGAWIAYPQISPPEWYDTERGRRPLPPPVARAVA